MVLTRLLYAHRLLLDPGYTVEDVALKLGYSKTKTLQMHLRAVFGLTAGELRVSLSTEDALASVTQPLFHAPCARLPRRDAGFSIVDDEPALRRTLERALCGARVRRGRPSATLTSRTRCWTPATCDLVLLDLHLPQMSGDTFFLALVRRWPRLAGRRRPHDRRHLRRSRPTGRRDLRRCPMLLEAVHARRPVATSICCGARRAAEERRAAA